MAGAKAGFPGQIADKGLFADLVLDITRLGMPIVARLNGDAYGGGVGLFLACDIVVAADDVRVGLPEIKVGLWPMMVTALLVRHVGWKVASELMMLGEKLPAAEAKTLGLINRVVPRDALDATVDGIAQTLASRSPAVLKLGRDALYQTMDMPFDAALYSLRDRLVLNALFDDAAEGVMAFMQKRPPEWKGR
jgi:enoyl-CoA hydratase/carnithine racemase